MKRGEHLGKLSEDHRLGLVNALRLRRAAGDPGESPEAVADAFLSFWREHAEPHFRKEEEVLIPLMARREPGLGERPVLRMLLQHARIRGLVISLEEQSLRRRVRCETLRELGEDLEIHIRLEEREAFPLIESALSEEDLLEAERRMRDFTGVRPSTPYAEGLCFGPLPGPGNSDGGGED